MQMAAEPRPVESVWPRALAEAFLQQSPSGAPQSHAPDSAPGHRTNTTASDILKLRAEIAHLELLVKKLQTELQIERQYNQAMELQIRTLTQID